MQYIAEAIAFIAVLAAATALELRGKEAEVLWVMVMVWALVIGWRFVEEKKDGSNEPVESKKSSDDNGDGFHPGPPPPDEGYWL